MESNTKEPCCAECAENEKIEKEKQKEKEMHQHNHNNDHERQQAKLDRQHLQTLSNYAKELSGMITPETVLEPWVVAKISKAEADISEIKHRIEPPIMEHGGELGEPEGGHVLMQLQHLGEYADKLLTAMQNGWHFEPWMQSKLAVAASDVDSIKHYLEYSLKGVAAFAQGGEIDSEYLITKDGKYLTNHGMKEFWFTDNKELAYKIQDKAMAERFSVAYDASMEPLVQTVYPEVLVSDHIITNGKTAVVKNVFPNRVYVQFEDGSFDFVDKQNIEPTKFKNGGKIDTIKVSNEGSFMKGKLYEGRSIMLLSVPSPEYNKFYGQEIVVEEVKNGIVTKAFLRETGEKLPFNIDNQFRWEQYANGGSIESNITDLLGFALAEEKGVDLNLPLYPKPITIYYNNSGANKIYKILITEMVNGKFRRVPSYRINQSTKPYSKLKWVLKELNEEEYNNNFNNKFTHGGRFNYREEPIEIDEKTLSSIRENLIANGFLIDNEYTYEQEDFVEYYFDVDSTRLEGRDPSVRQIVERIAEQYALEVDFDLNRDNLFHFYKSTEKFKNGGKINNIQATDLNTEQAVEAIENAQPTSTQNLWAGDAYYKLNPDKILGEPYEASGRFGKVTKYRGNITAIDRIEADTDFLTNATAINNPLISTQEPKPDIFEPETQDNIKNALEQSAKEISVKAKKKSKVSITPAISTGDLTAEMQSFIEIYNKYNPEISDEELFAFIWYRDSIGERLSQNWYDLAFSKGATTDYLYSEQTLNKWVNEGILFYYGNVDEKKGSKKLIPAYLFLSGNMYDRVINLEREKDKIVELYGQPIYDQQKERLDLAWQSIYTSRLVVDGGEKDSRLILLPVSDFAKEFKISTLVDEVPFFAKADKDGKPKFGDPNFTTKSKYGRQSGTEFSELSLKDAFGYWLLHNKSKIVIKKNTTAEEITTYYLEGKTYVNRNVDKEEAAAERERIKARTKLEGDRIFAEFLAKELTMNDKVRLETEWNRKFNGVKQVDYNKIPVAFNCAKEFRNEPLDVRPEKREAAAFVFNDGAGCLAYGTGIGKTFSSIFALGQAMDAGYCERPVFVVPNQVYKQFLNEIKGLLPHRPILELYNMSAIYADKLRNEDGSINKIPSGTISIMTYEGFERIGFGEDTYNALKGELYEILNQGDDSRMSKKQEASLGQKIETIMGRGLSGTMFNIDEIGFDYVTFDEAHKGKKIFTSIKGNIKEDGESRDKNTYQISSGSPSSIGLKMFMISHYILRNFNNRNVVLLTATPFTNSPLEIFSMLSLISFGRLRDLGLASLTEFFDTFINVSYELVINAKLKPERRQVVLGFNNLVAMQSLIERFINYKGEDQVKSNKPNKWVLPLTKKKVGDEVIILQADERVGTYLPMSDLQARLMSDIKNYVQGTTSLEALCSVKSVDRDEEDEDTTEGFELSEDALSDDEKSGVKILRGMNYARNLALSPYLYECSGMVDPDYKSYIETSPKLRFVMGCIASVKKWHEDRNEMVSGQVIYMDRGVEYFELIKEYLVKELGYSDKEIGIIRSGLPKEGPRSKSEVQNRFLGQRWNPQTLDMEDIPDEDRIKIIIGSGTIREGINLQRYSTVLYNCFVDWNPTDQIQLDGRIHRQGNIFGNVRIVIPLMLDSMDIFMFQKLEEKTSRLNTIWAKNGRQNVLKLEDFDPKELKYVLIKDPYVLAELQAKEEVELVEDEIAEKQSELTRIEGIKEAVNNLKYFRSRVIDGFGKNVEFTDSDNDSDVVKKAIAALRKTTGPDGKPYLTEKIKSNTGWYYASPFAKKDIEKNYSSEPAPSIPYGWDNITKYYRLLARETRDYLAPRNLTPELLDVHFRVVESEIEAMQERKKNATSDDVINRMAEEIIREREAKQIKEKTVTETIEDFKKLNYLLGIKKVATEHTAKDEKAIEGSKQAKVAESETKRLETERKQAEKEQLADEEELAVALALAMEQELLMLELEDDLDGGPDNNDDELPISGNYEVELKALPDKAYSVEEYMGSVSIKPTLVKAKSLDKAKKSVASFIKKHQLGNGNMKAAKLLLNGKHVGSINYDGTVKQNQSKKKK